LDELGHPGIDATLNALGEKQVRVVMTQPVVTVAQDQPLLEAIHVMLAKGLKRLPVIDEDGLLTGMLARYDIFHAITREAPDWKGLQARCISVQDAHQVRDVMQRDVYSVSPETTVEEILKGLSAHEIQRAAVVDRDGKLLGLIADRDLLRAFSDDSGGFWAYCLGILSGRGGAGGAERFRAATAAQVMKRDVLTIREDAGIDEAVQLLATKKIKRLPVLDASGRFKGMISRDAVLRTVFAQP
jgi:CBS domain-containing protein